MRRMIDSKLLVVLAIFAIAGFVSFSSLTEQAEKRNASLISVPADDLVTPDGATKDRIVQDYGKLPLRFEENLGQTDTQVRFLARGKGYALFLTGTEAVLSLQRASDAEQEARVSDVVRIQLAGANANPEVTGQDVLPGKSNYLIGNDESQWRTDVSNYKKVAYKDVYDGIDMVYYGTEQGQLEYDFVVSPGVDPRRIQFSMEGAESLRLDTTGDLIVSTLGGEVTFQAPVTYQDIDDVRHSVESKYVLLASAEGADQMVGFELGAYDASHSVVIDPVLSYATYLGGGAGDAGLAITIDGSGNAYVTGYTLSSNFPTASAYQSAHGGGNHDAFVTKLNSAGSALVFSTYLGGSTDDFGFGIAVDGSGNVYVTGNTTSSNFPTASAYQATFGGVNDAFVTKLNSAGSVLVYSTYLGGSGNDQGRGISVDGSGNAYVTGFTSGSYLTASAYQSAYGGGTNDAFITKLNSAGSALVYSTYLGGSADDQGFGIAVDGSDNAYVTGFSSSSNFPTASAYQSSNGGSDDGFVTKLNSAGSALVYSTYLGGSGIDQIRGIAVDGSGNAYVTGYTRSSNFPTASAYQGSHGGGTDDGFVTKLSSAGSAVYSTYLGGSSDDFAFGIAVDGLGKAFVAGYTASSDFPMQSAHQPTHGGGGQNDVFVTVLTSTGSALDYSTFLGGSNREDGRGIAVDGSGNAVVTGWSNGSSFPTQSAYQSAHGGGDDVILAKFTGFATPPTTLGISIPDTVATYDTQILVPIRIENPATFDVVAAEISVTFDNSVVTLGSPDKTELTGTLVASGWSVEENVFSGVGGIDTLTIAMSTAADTLSSAGDLIKIVLDVANTRHPDSTPLELVSVLFNDGDPLASPTTDGSLTIIGTDGSIVASPDSINPADVVTVIITDADFDVDVGTAEQVTASAVSKLYGDTETVTLTETGVNTGIFSGTLNTSFSLVADPSQNGTLGTVAGDSICVSFLDSLDTAGASVTREDTVEVVGGVDGVVAVTYVVQAFDGRNGIRDTVRIEVADADLDTDVGVAEQVSATITNAISSEIETVTLTETGVNTGIFHVRVPTIAGASGTNEDGVLSLASWDTLDVSYTDNLTAQGGVAPVTDITRVVNLFGDVRVNDQVQAFDAARLLAISVGLITSNTQTTLVGDVDGNSSIQAFDASRVLQYVVRLIDRFGVQTDFTADPKNHPFEKPVPLGNMIALGNMEAQGDGTFLLPVSLGEREGILSGTLTLGVDAGVEVVDVDLANDYGSFMVAHNMTREGLKVAFAGSQSNLSGSGDVLMLKVRGVEGSPIRLSLDNVVLNGQTLTPSVNIEAMEEVLTQAPSLITELHQNIPNPFNPQTTIKYAIAEAGQVQMVIYSVTGQRVRTLLNEFQDSGSYQLVWDGKDALGRDVSSGIYLMRMQATGFAQTKKMMLLR